MSVIMTGWQRPFQEWLSHKKFVLVCVCVRTCMGEGLNVRVTVTRIGRQRD